MIYGGAITTPANTAEASPLVTDLAVTLGLIYNVQIVFPPGPSGLLHLQVFDGTYQLFPTTHGQSFSGDNLKLEFNEMYEKSAAPGILVVKTWNLDDTYAHEVLLLVSLVAKEEYLAHYLPTNANNMLVQALGEAQAAEALTRREKIKRFLGEIPSKGEG